MAVMGRQRSALKRKYHNVTVTSHSDVPSAANARAAWYSVVLAGSSCSVMFCRMPPSAGEPAAVNGRVKWWW